MLVKRTLLTFIVITISLFISACDSESKDKNKNEIINQDNIIDDRATLQQEIDEKNPDNRQAFCVRVSKNQKTNLIPEVVIDYTNYEQYFSGGKSKYELNKIEKGKNILLRLDRFTKAGLLEKGSYPGLPYYFSKYFFTKKGERYLNLEGGANLCFGRIIVDEIVDIADNEVNDDGQFKVITFNYHLEDVPDWMKDESIYSLYASHTDFINLVLGKQLTGKHTYKVAEDGTLTLWRGIRGNRYIL